MQKTSPTTYAGLQVKAKIDLTCPITGRVLAPAGTVLTVAKTIRDTHYVSIPGRTFPVSIKISDTELVY